MDEPLIVRAIRRYHPDWEPPQDNGREWIKCLCPFHVEERPSAVVSYDHDAFKCYACPVKGSAVGLIKDQEGVKYAEAKRIAEELSPVSDGQVQAKPAGQSSRRVFGDKGSEGSQRSRRSGPVHAGIRSRTTPWA